MRLRIHDRDSKAEKEMFFMSYISPSGSFCVRVVDSEGVSESEGHLLFITKHGALHLDSGVGERHGLVLGDGRRLKVH